MRNRWIMYSYDNITKNVRLHLFSNLRNGDLATYQNHHHMSECHSQDVGTYVPARGKVSVPVPALGCVGTCRHVLTYECFLTLTECTLQLGVYTPKPLCYHSHWSIHSNHTPNIIGVHQDATPWTSSNHSPIGNTLQCHFKCTPDGVYTPLPLL